MSLARVTATGEVPALTPPRLGFLGAGWIGRNRLAAVAEAGRAAIVAVADPAPERREEAARLAPDAECLTSFDDLLARDLDGLVIATPSALHVEQTVAALDRGLAVFCQKPLGRTAAEARAAIEAAARADRLLGIDLSYRYTTALARIRDLVRAGDLGDIYALDLVFHNAYGPDGAWFYNPRLAGGGCAIDLGIHLIDAALWILDFPAVENVSSRLFAAGQRLPPNPADRSEDYAVAQIDFATGAVARIACSWRLPAGQDAVIEARFFGTAGGAALRNLNGSFYDFVAERFHGTRAETLVEPPDAWGGRAIVEWVERLASGARYDPAVEDYLEVATLLDRMYGR